ncbi:MAG: cytochrome ubiquinol oxidase subunit I [Myxococcota bacterium]
MDAEIAHRFQFAFTITYHYLFPQLTMGLGLLIVVLKGIALRRDSEVANRAVRFWAKVFGVSFAMGVVTGIPMEFQFGTNWARFSEGSGAIIGQTLAMEGVFAFFLESAFLYMMLFGEKRLGQRGHFVACFLVFLGSWISGFFIVATNAFMQHPVGFDVTADGGLTLTSLGALLTNPWLMWEYPHVMVGAVITGSFVMTSIGAYYLLMGRHEEPARLFVRVGVTAGLIASVLAAFPTGDRQARMVADHQPVTFAAMEGHFHTEAGAPLVVIGQPDMEALEVHNRIELPKFLSFLTYQRWDAEIRGLSEFPRDEWPDNVPLLYFAYHIMVGLGTLFIALMGSAAWSLRGGRLFRRRWLLWTLMLAAPFPFIANTFGWHTAELGRQPWLIHGVMRTVDGYSDNVSGGNVVFTLLGFMGLYALLSILYVVLMTRIIGHGPEEAPEAPAEEATR